jgi:hypothetical protein
VQLYDGDPVTTLPFPEAVELKVVSSPPGLREHATSTHKTVMLEHGLEVLAPSIEGRHESTSNASDTRQKELNAVRGQAPFGRLSHWFPALVQRQMKQINRTSALGHISTSQANGRFWPILLKNSFSGATRKITGPQRRRSFSGFGGPCDVLLRATKSLLTNAPTIRGVDCRLQGTIARIRGECNLGFFNRIGRQVPIEQWAVGDPI